MKTSLNHKTEMQYFLFLVLFFVVYSANAGSTGMPWESTFDKILDSLQGPVAKVLCTASVVTTGMALAFSEGGSMLRKMLWVALGISVTFGAGSIISNLFFFSGGATF